MGPHRWVAGTASFVGALVWLTVRADGAEPCTPVVGELVSAQGTVEVQRAEAARWQPANVGDPLCERDTLRTGAYSRAAAALINDAVLRIDQNTTVHLADITREEEARSFFDLVIGAIQSFSRKPRLLAVNTPYLNATVEGTEFVIRVAQTRTELTVFEGVIAAANPQGQVTVTDGQSAAAEAGQAPEPRILVRPRDAVQWALYYPPVLAVLGGRTERTPPGLPAPLAEALGLAGRGDIGGALSVLDRVPEAERDAAFHHHRAALLLSVGRVEEARAAIDRALARDPGAGLAYALRAVIAVVQNEKAQALSDGARAVELSPQAAAAGIALSYAQQASFELEAARDTLLRVTEAQPEDPLAWARLAELWLSLGYRGRAREAAERAVELEPNLARTQVVLGFAALTQIRTDTAAQAFEQAIALDSADPLPRLGLGLARIRASELEAGRREIEIAVGLDGNNALLRAYLGKAYFEEKRDPLDAEQLAIAKELDPLDPTAFLYDAIRKQSENRPGEALDDLQASIERNDNRAVYRGRLQLDQDRAARGTSLARVYDDLGFTQLGVNEASKSLALDPANASAHRFLSDNYSGVRRREIARVSELLQAQMLQDININPVQPSISETNLNIFTRGGPAEAGFNEFTPLFERNQVQFNASGQVGNQDTLGGEGVVSAVYDRFSLSAGAFHFGTDGWRDNAEIDHDIYNFFGQAALTPDLNVQLEYRRRDSTSGDVTFKFDPDLFSSALDRDLEQQIARAGIRYSPFPNSDILFSYIRSDREESITDSPVIDFGVSQLKLLDEDQFDDDGNQFEAQYLYRSEWLNITAGSGFSDVERDRVSTTTVAEDFLGLPPGCIPPFCFVPPFPAGLALIETPIQEDIEHWRGYIYLNAKLPEPVTWTLGLSYDDLDREGADVNELNPKFGVQWDVTDSLRLRGTAFQVVKPIIVANRTIEPTQIAGFNQLFDDINGTVSETYGIGVDWQPMDNFFIGGEVTWREYEEVIELIGPGTFDISDPEERDEDIYRGYVYWTPIPEVSASAEVIFDRYTSEPGVAGSEFFPEEVETLSIPIGVRYFHRSGFFANLGVTYVDQDVDRFSVSPLPAGTDSFVTVDAGIGYRLPDRRGIVSVQVSNLLDENFKFLDDGFYREFRDDPTQATFIPDRLILIRGSLSF